MKLIINNVIALALMTGAPLVWSHPDADPMISMLSFKQLEQRKDGDETNISWDVDAWLGKDLHKLWIKSEGDYRDGQREGSEVEILYSKAVAPFWDVQTGWRSDFNDTENRQWFALGLQGLAPYFFETELTFYLGENGQTAFRIDTEYELLITQRLILTPELEANFYGRNDRATNTGSGLSEIETGLRLRYEIRREFAPYIGVNYRKAMGKTADYSRDMGETAEATEWLVGIKFWF